MAIVRQLATWVDARRRIVAVVLMAWVVLVVIGAGEKTETSGRFALPDLQNVFVVVLGLFALCGLVLLPFIIREQEGKLERRPARQVRGLIIVTALVVLVAFLVGPQDLAVEPIDEAPLATEPVLALEEPTTGEPDDLDDSALVVLFLTCAAAGALLLWSRRRLASALGDAAGGDHDRTLEAEVGRAIDEAIDHLLGGGDPRMAVLAAYASLERSLAANGLGRQPHETPTEHLARVLAATPVVLGPAVRLGELYELARFSDHPITRSDQRQAAEALDQSRRELAEHLSVAR